MRIFEIPLLIPPPFWSEFLTREKSFSMRWGVKILFKNKLPIPTQKSQEKKIQPIKNSLP